jgi:hypothetical protein
MKPRSLQTTRQTQQHLWKIKRNQRLLQKESFATLFKIQNYRVLPKETQWVFFEFVCKKLLIAKHLMTFHRRIRIILAKKSSCEWLRIVFQLITILSIIGNISFNSQFSCHPTTIKTLIFLIACKWQSFSNDWPEYFQNFWKPYNLKFFVNFKHH